jgi:hypothetical protein
MKRIIERIINGRRQSVEDFIDAQSASRKIQGRGDNWGELPFRHLAVGKPLQHFDRLTHFERLVFTQHVSAVMCRNQPQFPHDRRFGPVISAAHYHREGVFAGEPLGFGHRVLTSGFVPGL